MKKAKDIIVRIGAMFLLVVIVASIVFGIYSTVSNREGEKVWVEEVQQYCTITAINSVAYCPGRKIYESHPTSWLDSDKIRKNLVSQGCAVSPMPYHGEYALSYGRITAQDIRECVKMTSK